MAKRPPGTRAANQTGRRRFRWVVVALLLAVVAVVGFAVVVTRGVSWRDRFPITGAWLSEPDHLRLVVNTCGGNPELDLLREQTEVVEVAVVSTRTFGGPGGGDCQDLVEVQLQAPLGDRRLVDATTGDEVAVEPG